MIKRFIIICILPLNICTSCHSDSVKAPGHVVLAPEKKISLPKETLAAIPQQRITVEFIGYNDDGDYELFNARKGSENYSFVNAANEKRTLLRGDLVELTWQKDTIYMAGDGDLPQEAKRIVSATKVKDGKVSEFRKGYQKELKYYIVEADKYSKSYLDKLYLIVEYYVANSQNELLKLQITNRNDLSYSIEAQTRADKEYTMIGIATAFEHKTNVVQWLYFDSTSDLLYEYDLPNDQLIKFDK